METINSIIDTIDIFSTEIHLTIKGRQRISSIIGVITSFLIGVTGIVLFFVLGGDFLHRKNPRTSTSQYENAIAQRINLSEQNLTFAFRYGRTAIPYLGNDVNLVGGELDSKLEHRHVFYNTTEEKTQTVDKKVLNGIYQCPDSFIIQNNLLNGTYYCLDFGIDFLFGGSSRDSEYDAYFLSIFRCLNGIPNGFFEQNCTSIEQLNKWNAYQYSFQIVYPILFFDPTSKENSIKIVYTSDSFIYDLRLPISYVFYLANTIFEDDSGWLFEEKKNSSYWGVDEVKAYYTLKGEDSLKVKYSSSTLLTFTIQMKHSILLHTRYYIKLPELLSSIFSIIKIITTGVSILFLMLLEPVSKGYAMFELFYDGLNRGQQFKKIKNLKPPLQQNNVSSINNHLINFSKTSNINRLNGVNKRAPTSEKLKNKTSTQKPLTKCSYIRYKLFWFCCTNSGEKERFNIIKEAESLVKSFYDFQYYTSMIYKIKLLQKCLLPPEIVTVLHYHKKANLWEKDEMKTLFDLKNNNYSEDIKIMNEFFQNGKGAPNNTNDPEFYVKIIKERVKQNIQFKIPNQQTNIPDQIAIH